MIFASAFVSCACGCWRNDAQLRRCIYELKGIPSRRQKLSFENGGEIPERMESWTLRRIGLSNHSVIIVSPTRSGMWLWHPLEHYRWGRSMVALNAVRAPFICVCSSLSRLCRMQVINQVLAYLEDKHSFEVELRELEKAVPIPSMVPDPMLVLLRQYPDYIDVFPDNAQGKIFIHKATLFQGGELSREGRADEAIQQPQGAERVQKVDQEATAAPVEEAGHEHRL